MFTESRERPAAESLVKVTDFESATQVTDEQTLAVFLGRRHAGGFNAFWCCHAERFPAMHVLASGDLACVAYYPDEDQPEQYLKGGRVVPLEGTSEFRMDASMDPEPRDNAYVVAWDVAVAVVSRFLAKAERPAGVEWLKMFLD